ncbi:MAG: NADH-quinone oxidoreductase subunit L [Armatimonadota bacterium]|nr:MAG: NADH-quinone oxidoreductase subunit L [Armatimonadota bacterium]
MTSILIIPALPLASFLIIAALFLRPQRSRFAPYVLVAALAASLALSLSAAIGLWQSPTHAAIEERGTWLAINPSAGSLTLEVGVLLDPLSALMLVVVSLVSLLIQIYSMGYMRGDPGYGRYFAFMSLFSFSMLGLVASNNFLQTYVFWELVGLCSYLLIGYYYQTVVAANAAKKAFIVTRFGDVGFLIGIIALSYAGGTFNFLRLEQLIESGGLTPFFFGQSVFVTVTALLIFSGAVGKSAQFPLHVWLPDAMEGPTPVSALIHAATMVAAGVYLVARAFFVFHASGAALVVVACIGAFTAFLAATIAVVQSDIKRVLAYSTISQLGYMMLALGAGSVAAGMFHLTTHAFFKALLFLCAGSVIHAMHTNDMWEMGGLGKPMRATAITCAIGALALAGIWPLSGFYSKDQVLAAVATSPGLAAALGTGGRAVLLGFGLAVVFLTAFYMTRMWATTFAGKPRGKGDAHAHESPAVMILPMAVLALLAIVGGLLNHELLGAPLNSLLGAGEAHEGHAGWVVWASLGLAVCGIASGWMMYGAREQRAEPLAGRIARPVYRFVERKWYMDDFYHGIVARVVIAASAVFAWFDRHVVNGFVDGAAWLMGAAGRYLRLAETGQLQFYALVLLAAAALIGLALAFLGVGFIPTAAVVP